MRLRPSENDNYNDVDFILNHYLDLSFHACFVIGGICNSHKDKKILDGKTVRHFSQF